MNYKIVESRRPYVADGAKDLILENGLVFGLYGISNLFAVDHVNDVSPEYNKSDTFYRLVYVKKYNQLSLFSKTLDTEWKYTGKHIDITQEFLNEVMECRKWLISTGPTTF